MAKKQLFACWRRELDERWQWRNCQRKLLQLKEFRLFSARGTEGKNVEQTDEIAFKLRKEYDENKFKQIL